MLSVDDGDPFIVHFQSCFGWCLPRIQLSLQSFGAFHDCFRPRVARIAWYLNNNENLLLLSRVEEGLVLIF